MQLMEEKGLPVPEVELDDEDEGAALGEAIDAEEEARAAGDAPAPGPDGAVGGAGGPATE